MNGVFSSSSISARTCLSCRVSDLNGCIFILALRAFCLSCCISPWRCSSPLPPWFVLAVFLVWAISLACSLALLPLSYFPVQHRQYLIDTFPCLLQDFRVTVFSVGFDTPKWGFSALANALLSKFAVFQLITLTLILMYLYFIHFKSCFFPLSI